MNTLTLSNDDFDPALIDRLVDGTLPTTQRSALLRRLEAHPDGWRRCALAFLEAQTWREALAPLAARSGELSTQSSPPPTEARSVSAGSPARPLTPPDPSLTLRASTNEGGRELNARRPGNARSQPFPKILRPLALAASLAIAFALGRSLPSASTRPVAPIVARPTPPPVEAPSIEQPPRLAAATPPATIIDTPTSDPISNPNDPLAIIPADLRRQLASDGFRVEPRGGYRPIQTADGRTVRVPYHDVRVRFVGNRTY